MTQAAVGLPTAPNTGRALEAVYVSPTFELNTAESTASLEVIVEAAGWESTTDDDRVVYDLEVVNPTGAELAAPLVVEVEFADLSDFEIVENDSWACDANGSLLRCVSHHSASAASSSSIGLSALAPPTTGELTAAGNNNTTTVVVTAIALATILAMGALGIRRRRT